MSEGSAHGKAYKVREGDRVVMTVLPLTTWEKGGRVPVKMRVIFGVLEAPTGDL